MDRGLGKGVGKGGWGGLMTPFFSVNGCGGQFYTFVKFYSEVLEKR